MIKYVDWLDTTDYDDQVEFPYEGDGDIDPYYEKKITSEWSLPSHDDNDDFVASVESTLDAGMDANAGDWEFSGANMSDATYLKIKSFYETNPPDNRFVFYKHRRDTQYLVQITYFKAKWIKRWSWYEWKIKLKNKGVIT